MKDYVQKIVNAFEMLWTFKLLHCADVISLKGVLFRRR